MPRRRCVSCKRLQIIQTADWKYLDKNGPLVCSGECLLEWIAENSNDGRLDDSWVVCESDALELWDHELECFFRSWYERCVAIFFRRNHIRFEYECNRIVFESDAVWTPDFYLPDHNIIIEVKGPWKIGDRKKVDLCRQVCAAPILVIPWNLHNQFIEMRCEEEDVFCQEGSQIR
jgi:hypothetical protein